jgi:hypothetical protein
MRGDDSDELAGRDDLGFLPEFWKMALVAGYEIVGAGGIGTFKKAIVAGIKGDLKRLRGRNKVSAVLNELKQLKAEPFPNTEFRARQDCPVFQKDRRRHVQTRWLRDGEKQDRALQSVGLERGRNHDVGVENQSKRKHWPQMLILFSRLALWGFRFFGARSLNDAVNLRGRQRGGTLPL